MSEREMVRQAVAMGGSVRAAWNYQNRRAEVVVSDSRGIQTATFVRPTEVDARIFKEEVAPPRCVDIRTAGTQAGILTVVLMVFLFVMASLDGSGW